MLTTLFQIAVILIALYLVIDLMLEPGRKAKREAYLKATLSPQDYSRYTANKILRGIE